MILQIILFLYIFIVPGYLLSKLWFKKLNLYERIGISIGSAFFILPLLNFSLAWLLNTYLTLTLVITSTTIINIVLLLLVSKCKTSFKNKFVFSKQQISFLVLCLTIFSIHFLNFEGPSKDYWSTYIVSTSMVMCNDKVDFIDIKNNSLYDYELEGSLKQNLIQKDAYGIITKDQRIGAPIIYSLPYLIFGLAGFRIFHSLLIMFSFIMLYYLFNYLFKSEFIAIIGSLTVTLNPLLFYFNRANANIVSLAIIPLFLFLMVNKKYFFLSGLLFGILGGVRNVAIIFTPAVIIYMFMSQPNKKILFNQISMFLIGALIISTPFMLWKYYAFGNIFAHPTQFEGLYGFRPSFEHSFIGIKFMFNGLLNYPFYKEIVRTPHFPFPNFITMPLLLMKSYGILLFSLAIIGFPYLLSKKKNIGIFMCLIFVPFLLFLMVQENWEELKSSFLILILPAFGMFIVAGLISLKSWFKKRKYRKISITLISLILCLFISIYIIEKTSFKLDERWYVRFPHAKRNETSIKTLPDNLRLDWHFFYTDETKEEYLQQKNKYTDIGLFPKLKSGLSIRRFSGKSFIKNIGKKDLTALDVWNYIYG